MKGGGIIFCKIYSIYSYQEELDSSEFLDDDLNPEEDAGEFKVLYYCIKGGVRRGEKYDKGRKNYFKRVFEKNQEKSI